MTAVVTTPTAAEPLLEAEEVRRYADAVVHACLGLAENDLLVVSASIAHRELAIALAESGYRAGARLVEVLYEEPYARYTEALVPPPGDVLDEWEFYWEIARRLGTPILTAGGPLPASATGNVPTD